MTPWGDGLPGFDDVPVGGWGDGLPLGPSTGGPRVVSATLVDSVTVRLTYDKAVWHANPAGPVDSLNPANYAFTGGIAASAVVINQASPTIVDITVAPEMEFINYTVTVSAVQDLGGNVVDPLFNSATYLGPFSPIPPTPEASNFIAEILIGSEVVWSAVNAVPQQNIVLDVKKFFGKLPLTFRIRGVS